MAVGDVTNPKRVRMQANERLDTVDTDGFSVVAREHLDAWSRAIEAVPRNVGSSTPTGLIFQGFELTLNPTGASDNKVRVAAAVGVAFDADGRMLVKDDGLAIDLTLPSGNSQIYVYYIETDSDTAVRRRISVTSPYTESGTSIPTKFRSSVAFFVRAGDQTSIVGSAVVNGATTALCFLGVANNAAGVITMTGYNAVTAPNGAFATNRITSIPSAPTLPSANTNNGSVTTTHGLIIAALYALGQAVWKGSKNFTPAAANNFGAFTPPTVGLDGLFDSQAEATLTPTTRWRDWQQNIRYLVDHQGYPGGQISVLDEHWFVYPLPPVNVDPTLGFRIAGAPVAGTATPFGIVLAATADVWAVPIDRPSVPIGPTSSFTQGGIITGIIVHYSSTNAANTLTAALVRTSLSTKASATQVSRTVTTTVSGTGVSFDVMVTPTAGQGPKAAASTERLHLQLSCTITAGTVTVYNVQVIYAMPPAGWAAFISDTAAGAASMVNFAESLSGVNQRNVQIVTNAPGSSGSSSISGTPEVFVDDDLAHSMWFLIRTGTVIDGSNTAQVDIRMRSASPALAVSWGLFRAGAGANWQLRMDPTGLAAVNVDTGIAFASSTTYRVKLEFQGANRNTSGFARSRCWINGALVATNTMIAAIVPATARVEIAMLATGTSGPYDFRIGRIRRAWNHLAVGDNV